MIENPYPSTWQGLQGQVNRIFCDIGLKSEVGKIISTPRGTIEIDVYAIDTKSVDKIKYIVECKNWSSSIPQTVVHAFTTVLHETGGNVGYIISKQGLQSGAIEYTKNTNIQGITFLEFQLKYFFTWFNNYFATQIDSRADALVQYTEPFNSKRTEYIEKLSQKEYQKYEELCEEYHLFAAIMSMVSAPKIFQRDNKKVPENIEEFKRKISSYRSGYTLHSEYFRDLLNELFSIIDEATDKFHNLFGRNIFFITE